MLFVSLFTRYFNTGYDQEGAEYIGKGMHGVRYHRTGHGKDTRRQLAQ